MESTFQSWTLAYLNSIPDCRAENVSGSAQQSGRPDINGCYMGRAFKLELKVPDHKNKATLKQQLNLRKWAAVGCAVGVLYSKHSVEKFICILAQLDYTKQWEETIPEENGCESWFKIPRIRF